jgi:hypothetical protein
MLIPRSVSHHRPGVRDDQPFQYDTNDWFSLENESLLLCSLAVISLRIPWDVLSKDLDALLSSLGNPLADYDAYETEEEAEAHAPAFDLNNPEHRAALKERIFMVGR